MPILVFRINLPANDVVAIFESHELVFNYFRSSVVLRGNSLAYFFRKFVYVLFGGCIYLPSGLSHLLTFSFLEIRLLLAIVPIWSEYI